MVKTIRISTSTQGLQEITRDVAAVVSLAEIDEGLCTLLLQHTSASLIIQENADPSARRDLEAWLNRLVPAHLGQPDYSGKRGSIRAP